MSELIDVSALLTAVGILTVITNIIVEVLKKVTYSIIPTQFLAVGVSEILTICAYVSWCVRNGVICLWYMNMAAVVVGFFVAYAAMFGFDALKAALAKGVGGINGKDKC